MSDDNVLPFPEPLPAEVEPLIPAIEALLFAAGEPVTAGALATALQVDDPLLVAAAARALARRLRERGAGILVVEVAGGFQARTHPRFAAEVLALRGGRPQRLSRAALEVLSIIAYQQPATRQDVEEVRGVASGAVIKGLIERGLLKVVGREEIPGRPLQYGTTSGFLEVFGLPDLKALPTLAEREALEEDFDGGP
ncbi:MAG: SMC-Scp complex subunit ScpB [Deltaproteobacteria bacterium]|nr:MAG: SMC-Scp complex subunit ScpB [Deltaproteobacteria bacterium]